MTRSLDRVRIEAYLHTDAQPSIEEWCRCLGASLDTWPQQREARGWLELAITRAVDKTMQAGRARSYTSALRIVCGAFGLDDGDVRLGAEGGLDGDGD